MEADKPSATGISLTDLDKAPSNIDGAKEPVSASVYDEILEKFSRVSDEKVALQEEYDKLRKRVSTSAILDSLIQPYANKAFWFMCSYCLVVGIVIFLEGFKIFSFNIEAGVLQVLVGSTAVTVIGLVGMVLTGIFVGARKSSSEN